MQSNDRPAFTPGPWEWWDDEESLVRITESAEQKLVASSLLPSNARLIAAAPELYENIENWLFLVASKQVRGIGIHRFATRTRELLAKARGDNHAE